MEMGMLQLVTFMSISMLVKYPYNIHGNPILFFLFLVFIQIE